MLIDTLVAQIVTGSVAILGLVLLALYSNPTRFATRFARPYHKGHLFHSDKTLYMGRWSLFETKWLSARIHHIATKDYDIVMHDHPWNFLSFVIRGNYTEALPLRQWTHDYLNGVPEPKQLRYRAQWSFAYRRATDRHYVHSV